MIVGKFCFLFSFITCGPELSLKFNLIWRSTASIFCGLFAYSREELELSKDFNWGAGGGGRVFKGGDKLLGSLT